ncbi:sensor histidine kinase [Massilia sp. GCM10023247]|uniref:sensor histidine kinase n=1 Tax=Massilia sp. GCM10023247 TaxID=3252643 RepID=UPI0036175F42
MTPQPTRHAGEGDFAFESNFSLIAAIRLTLAGAVLVAYLIDIPGQVSSHHLTWAVIAAYLLYSVLLFGLPQLHGHPGIDRHIYWADLAWYGLLTTVTDPSIGGVFLFYFFAILAASFRQGFKAGIAITFASAAMYLAVLSLGPPGHGVPEAMTVFLRVFFLICLGSMIAMWGGSELASKRRLALLRELNALSNPRFGAEQGWVLAMTKLRRFFDADACIVVLRDDAGAKTMREYSATSSGKPDGISEELCAALAPTVDEGRVFTWQSRAWHTGRLQAWDPAAGAWAAEAAIDGAAVAGLLNAPAWMSAPLRVGKEKGRIYLLARDGRFSRGDAVFFLQAVEQVFRLIEHVRALDGLASGAAAVERGRIVTDLHDTAIQPYIGLRIGLSALRTQVADTHALAEPLDRMLKMTSAVVQDLRNYVGQLERHHVACGSLLADALHDIAARFEEFHGVAVRLSLQPGLELGDRLAAEVLHIVREGLSNVHRHTRARECTLTLSCEANRLHILIGNPRDGADPCPAFSPRSLLKRVQALGGEIEVRAAAGPSTLVRIAIPL